MKDVLIDRAGGYSADIGASPTHHALALLRHATVATLAAALLLLAATPWTEPWAIPAPLVCLLPVSFALSWGIDLLRRAVRWLARRMGPTAQRARAPAFALVLSATVFLAGAVVANLAFVDEPLEGNTLWGYAASATAAVVLTVALARSRSFHRWTRKPHQPDGTALLLLACGGALSVIDSVAFTAHYDLFHRLLSGTTLAIFIVAVQLTIGRSVPPRLRFKVAALAAAATAIASTSITLNDQFSRRSIRAAVSHASVHRRVISMARQLSDGDGDGYSAWLGGGDCDDRDPGAFPFSVHGDPCLTLLPDPEPPPLMRANEAVGEAPPRLLILITVDAFRCGFSGAIAERPALQDACPQMSQLGAAGHLKPDARAVYPATSMSLAAIHRTSDGHLSDALSELGYYTIMVPGTSLVVGTDADRGRYDLIRHDAYLGRLPGRGCSAPVVTETVLDEARHALATHERVFVWAHYFDPHAPYVRTPRQSLVIDTDLDRYVAEVRRVDAAIGTLARTLTRDPALSDAAIVMTADHSEEFGEHGGARHGATLYATAIRVPMLAWRAGADPRRGLPHLPPAGGDQVADYLMAVATGTTFERRDQTLMSVRLPGDEQLGIAVDNWKLIYHRTLGYMEVYDGTADPFEQTNLAETHPDETLRLLSLLYREYSTDTLQH